jgi:hypothetical protein
MKIVLIIGYIFFRGTSLAQSYQYCVDSLYSENYGTKIFAIRCVNDFQPEGAIDVLVELIKEQQPYLQIQFLNALYSLEYEEVATEAHELISRADGFGNYPEYPWDPLDAKVFATAILVYKGDYSTIGYVFEQLNQDEITITDALSLHLLSYIMDNIPAYKDEAKNILLNELNNSSEEIRYFALLYLAEEFGEEMNNELIDRFVDDSDLPTRSLAFQYLCVNNYSGLNLLLKQQLESEEEPSLRIDIADSILYKFGEPPDLKDVINYQPNEPDGTAKSLIAYSIQEFIPPQPDSTVPLDLLLEKLKQYVAKLTEFEWILVTSYDFSDTAEAINDYYINEEYASVYETIEKFVNAAETAWNNEEITDEGYKFLHYYPIYIKQRIEILL